MPVSLPESCWSSACGGHLQMLPARWIWHSHGRWPAESLHSRLGDVALPITVLESSLERPVELVSKAMTSLTLQPH